MTALPPPHRPGRDGSRFPTWFWWAVVVALVVSLVGWERDGLAALLVCVAAGVAFAWDIYRA